MLTHNPLSFKSIIRLESLLELSTRTSAANSDQYKDNLRVALLPYDLSFQMGKIQALNTVEEAEYQTCDTSLLSGMDAFAFGYEVQHTAEFKLILFKTWNPLCCCRWSGQSPWC